LTEIAIKRKKK